MPAYLFVEFVFLWYTGKLLHNDLIHAPFYVLTIVIFYKILFLSYRILMDTKVKNTLTLLNVKLCLPDKIVVAIHG